MIEAGKFGRRKIHKTPHGGTYSIARFHDGKTNLPCDEESADIVTITEYNDKDQVIYSTRWYKGDAIKYPTIPSFLRKKE